MRKNGGFRHASTENRGSMSSPRPSPSGTPRSRYNNSFDSSGRRFDGRLHHTSIANRGANSRVPSSLPFDSEPSRRSHGGRYVESNMATDKHQESTADPTQSPKRTSQASSLVIPPGTRPPKVCSILQNAMAGPNIRGRRRNVSSPSKRRLQQQPHQKQQQPRQELPQPTHLVLRQVTLDAAVTAALLELLSSSFKPYSSSTNRHWESLELQSCRGHFTNLWSGIVAELTPENDPMAAAPGSATRRHFKRLCVIKPKPSTTAISTLGKALSSSAYICLQELRIETSFSEAMALALAEGLAKQIQSQSQKPARRKSTRFHYHANSDPQRFPQLRCLDLSKSGFETSDSFRILVDEGIAKNTTLQELHLASCNLEDEDIAYLINNGLQLHLRQIYKRTHHDQAKTPVPPPSKIPSSAGLEGWADNSKIQELNLASNFCQAKAIQALFASSSTMHPSQEAYKGCERRGKEATNFDNPQSECWLIHSLRRLDISQQDVWDERSYLQEPLTRALQDTSCRLEYLNLSYSFISDQHMSWLAPALSKNQSLHELNLRGNALDDDGLIQLASVVMSSSTTRLEILNLCHNRFGLLGIQALVPGMRANTYLKQLVVLSHEELVTKWSNGVDDNVGSCYDDEDFNKNPSSVYQPCNLPDERLNDHRYCLEMAHYYTCLNKGGRFLLRDSNAIPLALWPEVLERALHIATSCHLASKSTANDERQDNTQEEGKPILTISNADVAYCLLRHGPVLLNR